MTAQSAKSTTVRRRAIALSIVGPAHRDYDILKPIEDYVVQKLPDLSVSFPALVVSALEYVIDPIRTGRNKLSDLDNVEKTFIGLKVEHFLRDRLDAPKGLRDLVIGGRDVDVKNTVSDSWSWMIPQETYSRSEPCILVAVDETRREAWLGLFVARPEYLSLPNRDKKCGIKKSAYIHIRWLAQGLRFPIDRWESINMERFRYLRVIPGGSERAATFFEENLRRPIHRSVLQALLYDQKDYMKRLRGNLGAKDLLKPKSIALLSGAYDNPLIRQLGMQEIDRDEFVAVDVRSELDRTVLAAANRI